MSSRAAAGALLALVALSPASSRAETCGSCPEREAVRSLDLPFDELVRTVAHAARCVPVLRPELDRTHVPVRWRYDGSLGSAPLVDALGRLLATMGVGVSRAHAYSRTSFHCRLYLRVTDRAAFRAAVARGLVEGPPPDAAPRAD